MCLCLHKQRALMPTNKTAEEWVHGNGAVLYAWAPAH